MRPDMMAVPSRQRYEGPDPDAETLDRDERPEDTGRESLGASSSGSSGPQSAAATDASTTDSTGPDIGQAQQLVKGFVRNFVKGRNLAVLAIHGGLTECIVTLDRQLTSLSLQLAAKRGAKKRNIPLEQIERIAVGDQVGNNIDLPLDDLCATLLLLDGSAVGFRFDSIEDRDTFSLCLSMFVDGRKGEVSSSRQERDTPGNSRGSGRASRGR